MFRRIRVWLEQYTLDGWLRVILKMIDEADQLAR